MLFRSQADFAGADTIRDCAPYTAVFIDQTNGYPTQWHWNFGDGAASTEQNPSHTFNTLQSSITFSISDDYGCTDTTVKKLVLICEAAFSLADAFTPNSDGINDTLKIMGKGIKEVLDFRIYNRWGQVVFETNDVNQGWDGKFKGEYQPGETYTYYIRVADFQNQEIEKKGQVVLLR